VLNAPGLFFSLRLSGEHSEYKVEAVLSYRRSQFQTARTLPLDNDLAVPPAQFDLANVSARAVNLFGDQERIQPGEY
jgi:hypothetical protein